MINRQSLQLLMVVLAAASLLLSGCSSKAPKQGVGSLPPAGMQTRPDRDGPPLHQIDVSKIPDAVPTPHNGPYKASPYQVFGVRYVPMQDGRNYRETGLASWYGTKFHGQLTANGEAYDLYGMTAAHKTLPLPSYVRVTNLDNGRQIIVRVNDRGPFHSNRIIDLSYAGAKKLGFAESGTARVRVEGIDPVAWQRENRGAPTQRQVARAPAPAPVAVSSGQNLYLQAGAFASPQAAEQLRQRLQSMVQASVFVSPTQGDAQTLHRVRLGPINSQAEAEQLIEALRLANLGTPVLVTRN
ncbi:rare lipoprotein A [Halopseudomonas yangmingensis]|uniref:Endolytic peptidoglycan transglycosylase RlpA n=2 Tax=Halopseudomonas yangmingensis TaxID=1720063 RepID=A0A1I4PZR7_9GAMM|nr:rare lipoprotein A [Halopseudomonas yangmingensis]